MFEEEKCRQLKSRHTVKKKKKGIRAGYAPCGMKEITGNIILSDIKAWKIFFDSMMLPFV